MSFPGESDEKTLNDAAVRFVDIFGIPIAALHLPELLQVFHRQVSGARVRKHFDPYLIAYANAHSCNLLHTDPAFREAMDAMDLVYADGNGPRFAAWLKGESLPPRMTGADWIESLCALCAEHGHSMYLLGGQPGIASRAAEVLIARFPELVILDTYHGYLSEREEQQVVQSIRKLKPDILILGMGSPKQELWMMRHKDELDVPVIWGAGGALDYASGMKRRAPLWMRKLALEWLGRMIIEPRRLMRRYLLGIPAFLNRALRSAIVHHYRSITQPGTDPTA